MSVLDDAKDYLEKMREHERCCGVPQMRALVAETERMRAALQEIASGLSVNHPFDIANEA